METSSSNQDGVNPSSWKEKDLKGPIRELVEVLEALLEVKFPQRPPKTTMENSDRPMMIDIAKLIIGYHQYTSEKEIASDKTIYQWLNIGPDEIPSPESIFKQLQTPHIIPALTSHGLASYRLPLMDVTIYHPSPKHIELTGPDTTCNIDGRKNVCYLYIAENIVQGRIAIKTEINILAEALSYEIQIGIKSRNFGSRLHPYPRPFQHPTHLSIMICNVIGAEISAFQDEMETIVQNCARKIIILTETRINSTEAYILASRLGYQQVITEDPINYNGGICMLANFRDLLMKELQHTKKEIIVHLLKI